MVMKEDITQLARNITKDLVSCGLVMKEDITQPERTRDHRRQRCGLVMKEDITQLSVSGNDNISVVVW